MDISAEEIGNMWDEVYSLIENVIDSKNGQLGKEFYKKSYFLDFDVVTIKNQIWD